MTSDIDQELGEITGTADKDYNILWFAQQCLENVVRFDRYQADAKRMGDNELADFFSRAQADSRKGAEQAKELLAARLSG